MMKKNDDILLADMYERKSQHGNTYFSGKSETGGKFILVRQKNKKGPRGEQIWQLFMNK